MKKIIGFKITASSALGALLLVVGTPVPQAADTIDLTVNVTAAQETPDTIVQSALLGAICPGVSENGSTDGPSLAAVCVYLQNVATPDEITAIAKELSAKVNTSPGITINRTVPRLNLSGIGIRLLALRRAASEIAKTKFSASAAEEPGGLFSQRLSAFVNVKTLGNEFRETTSEIGSDMSNRGLLLGGDYRLDNNTFLGIAGQLDRITAELTDKGSDLDANQWGLIAYGSHYFNAAWYLEGTLTSFSQSFALNRQIDLTLGNSAIHTTAKSDTGAQQRGIYVGSGYELSLPRGFTGVATLGLSYLRSHQDAYQESHAGDFSLAIDSQKTASTLSLGNARIAKAWSTPWGVLFPQLGASWVHEFSKDTQEIRARFINDQTHTPFAFRAQQPDPNYFVLEADLQMLLPQGRMAFIKYSTLQRLRDTTEYSLVAGFRMEL